MSQPSKNTDDRLENDQMVTEQPQISQEQSQDKASAPSSSQPSQKTRRPRFQRRGWFKSRSQKTSPGGPSAALGGKFANLASEVQKRRSRLHTFTKSEPGSQLGSAAGSGASTPRSRISRHDSGAASPSPLRLPKVFEKGATPLTQPSGLRRDNRGARSSSSIQPFITAMKHSQECMDSDDDDYNVMDLTYRFIDPSIDSRSFMSFAPMTVQGLLQDLGQSANEMLLDLMGDEEDEDEEQEAMEQLMEAYDMVKSGGTGSEDYLVSMSRVITKNEDGSENSDVIVSIEEMDADPDVE